MKNTDNQKGATLVGVLIGITILSIALASQLRLLSTTLKREVELRNRIIATNLAREGIEMGLIMRNYFGWDEIKGKTGDNICPDYYLDNLDDLSKYCNTYLKFKSGFYQYGSGEHSGDTFQFQRTVSYNNCEGSSEEYSSDDCLLIKSKVEWEDGEELELTKVIFNWYTP